MGLRNFLLAMSLLAILVSVKAIAQEDEIDAAIAQGRASASVRELQAQANAEPPKTNNTRELCVFYHKRGVARHRIGDYRGAVEDLRVALSHNPSRTDVPLEWGFRWRIQRRKS